MDAIYAIKPADKEDPLINRLIDEHLVPYYPSSKKATTQYTIPISKVKLTNALQATASKRFGIKGFKLKYDSVIWSMLVDFEYGIYKYPFSYTRAGEFLKFLDTVEFYNDFPLEWQCVSKLTAIAFHASAATYRYRSKHSLGYWCRYLVEYVGLLFFKLFCKIRILGQNDRKMFEDVEAILEADGFTFDIDERAGLFFRYDFFKKFMILL